MSYKRWQFSQLNKEIAGELIVCPTVCQACFFKKTRFFWLLCATARICNLWAKTGYDFEDYCGILAARTVWIFSFSCPKQWKAAFPSHFKSKIADSYEIFLDKKQWKSQCLCGFKQLLCYYNTSLYASNNPDWFHVLHSFPFVISISYHNLKICQFLFFRVKIPKNVETGGKKWYDKYIYLLYKRTRLWVTNDGNFRNWIRK